MKKVESFALPTFVAILVLCGALVLWAQFHGPQGEPASLFPNTVRVGGAFNATLPTYTDGEFAAFQLDSRGRLVPNPSVAASQPATTFNSKATSAANAAVTTTIAAVAGANVYLYSVSARCSAGTATLEAKDGVGGTTIWDTSTGAVSTTNLDKTWPLGLATSSGAGMDVVLSTCGAGNTGVLVVNASRF